MGKINRRNDAAQELLDLAQDVEDSKRPGSYLLSRALDRAAADVQAGGPLPQSLPDTARAHLA